MSDIRILGERLLVERFEPEKKIKGIIIPTQGQEDKHQGRVMKVGTGCLLENGQRSEMQVKPGDHIMYTSFSGAMVEANGKEYVVLNERDVIAVVEPESEFEMPSFNHVIVINEGKVTYSNGFRNNETALKTFNRLIKDESNKKLVIEDGPYKGSCIVNSSYNSK